MKVVLKHLTKKFPGKNKKSHEEVIAVNDFDFEIPDGKLVGLLGPSGCGKSTTLNLISGLEAPTEGQVFFGEDDVTNVPVENRGVGLVFQNYALYPHLTVEENIIFPLQNLKGAEKLTKEQMKEKALEVAKLVQIEDYMERKPKALSGGQQQRVAIARALVKMPKVLLLDEPLSNLDARLRLQTREELRRIQKETGITTIFVTHDQEEAMSICDLMVVMKAGVVHQIGRPQDIYDDPKNLFVAQFLGTPPINVFNGKVENGKVMINGDDVFDAPGVPDQEVYLAVRPEGFIPNGSRFRYMRERREIMGRDVSIIFTHENALNPNNRAIVSAEENIPEQPGEAFFDLKPAKTFLFSRETEERIRF